MIRRACLQGLIAIAGLAVWAAPTSAETSAEVLKRASDAMGAGNLTAIRYVGEGIGFTYGQAYRPGGPWPKVTLADYVRTIGYDGAMRTQFVLTRAEPKGGGGYPLEGQQPNDQYLNGGFAWNVVGNNPVPGGRFLTERQHAVWSSPHGVIKAAMQRNAKVTWRQQDGKKLAVLAFAEPGRFAVTAYLDARYLVERVESRLPDPVLGETQVVTRYGDYATFGPIKFPKRIRQAQGGFPVLDLAVKDVIANPAVDLPVPAPVQAASDKVTAEKVADGVWFIAGGSHNSAVIEMQDHLLLVEAPLGKERTAAVIAQARQLVPGKPLRAVINTHQHFDHAGGLRTAAAEGLAVITQAGNVAYLQKALAAPARIAPDRLAKTPRKAVLRPVADLLVLKDAMRRVEVRRLTGSVHNDTFLMVYLPQEKLLIEADAFTPPPPNTPPPAKANANNLNLIDNIKRQKLAVDRILPLHGRVVPVSELYAAAKVAMLP